MEIKYFDYTGESTTVEIEGEITHIEVTVVSGDEILDVYFHNKDGQLEDCIFDNGGRIWNFFDGFYEVMPEDIDKWNQRHDSYDGLLMFEEEFWNDQPYCRRRL